MLDSCTKKAFSFLKQLYDQIDGVPMGSPLGPVLENLFLTDFEKFIISDLIHCGIIKFNKTYVNDTLF